MKPNTAFPIFFFAIWIALGVTAWILFSKASYETKRKWHPRFQVGVGVLFLGFIATVLPPFVLVGAIPAVALIAFLNLRMIKFCKACGATLVQNPPWSSFKYCPKCGAKLR